MATLELAVDARPMQRGAQEATQALDGVSKAAERTTAAVEKTGQAAAQTGKTVANAGASMRAAFQATGGSIQVAGGIAQTAKAFAELNVAAAAFGSSRALLEIGKTIQDFRELGETVGKTGSIFATLGAIVRANPLLTIATVLGTVGSLMSVFSSNTKQAANSFNELAAAMEKARMTNRTRAALGLPVTGQGQADVISQAMERSLAGESFNLTQFGPGGLGGGADVARYLAAQGNAQQQAAARQYLRTGGYQVPSYTAAASGPYAAPSGQMQFVPGLPSVQLTPQQTQDVLRMRYQTLAAQGRTVPQMNITDMSGTGVYEFGAAGPEGGALQESAMESARLQAEADRRSVEASEKVAQNMQAAADYAGNIGGQLGSAFADVLMKTTTLRQAFSSIVASIARQSLADVGAGILRGAVGGMTARQTGQNVGVSP
jgi:hypothetical protein